MLLCQINGTFVGDTQVNGELADEEHGQIIILGNQSSDGTHRNQANNRGFESCCCGYKILFGKISTICKVFAWFNHADNLTSTPYTIFEDFHFTTDETHQMRRCLSFTVDGFILFVGLYRIIVHQKLLLLIV